MTFYLDLDFLYNFNIISLSTFISDFEDFVIGEYSKYVFIRQLSFSLSDIVSNASIEDCIVFPVLNGDFVCFDDFYIFKNGIGYYNNNYFLIFHGKYYMFQNKGYLYFVHFPSYSLSCVSEEKLVEANISYELHEI